MRGRARTRPRRRSSELPSWKPDPGERAWGSWAAQSPIRPWATLPPGASAGVYLAKSGAAGGPASRHGWGPGEPPDCRVVCPWPSEGSGDVGASPGVCAPLAAHTRAVHRVECPARLADHGLPPISGGGRVSGGPSNQGPGGAGRALEGLAGVPRTAGQGLSGAGEASDSSSGLGSGRRATSPSEGNGGARMRPGLRTPRPWTSRSGCPSRHAGGASPRGTHAGLWSWRSSRRAPRSRTTGLSARRAPGLGTAGGAARGWARAAECGPTGRVHRSLSPRLQIRPMGRPLGTSCA
jgi:hypothetical protein